MKFGSVSPWLATRWTLLVVTAGILVSCGPGIHSGLDRNQSAFVVPPPVVDLQHRPGLHQELRSIVLDNGLHVLLVSDTMANKSAAALDVAVGSLEDPAAHPGLAHYLEHMLFLGTEKYPDVEGYKTYLDANQGYSNAYTASTSTNYHFQVNPDAYVEALDRFSQFFKAPIFDADFMEREKQAVNSEHSKNLDSDFWRRRMVERGTHRDGHPRKSFSTGDAGTLDGLDRTTVIDFYKKFYSANVMQLCLLSNHSLDELENMAHTWFDSVKNTQREKLEYSADVYDKSRLPELLTIKAVTQERELQLVFPSPADPDRWRAKPFRLIGSLVGNEGEGSLLSWLKSKGLATGISAWPQDEDWATYFRIILKLTKKGSQNINQVTETCFAYLRMLQDKGIPGWYWTEQKAMGELEYVFREHWEGAQLASWYAGKMQDTPALEIESRAFLLKDYNPALVKSLLAQMDPHGFRAVLLTPDAEKLDLVEPAYGTDYSRRTFSLEEQQAFAAAKLSDKVRFPDHNPYLPDQLGMLAGKDSPAPELLLDPDRGEFWFECNTQFGVPRGELTLSILSNEANQNPRQRLLNKMFALALNESLNEWRYPVVNAGLNFRIRDTSRGLQLEIDGFSQRLPELLRQLPDRLQKITINGATFDVIREQLNRDFANNDFSEAYSQCFYEQGILLSNGAIHRNSYRDLVDEISLDDVKAYARAFFAETALEGVATGNLEHDDLKRALEIFQDKLGGKRLPMADRAERGMVELKAGTSVSRHVSSKSNNHAWMGYVQFGKSSPELEAALRVGSTWLEAPFYGELRTSQQLGYIVFSGSMLSRDAAGMFYLIQSGSYAADDLRDRATEFLNGQLASLHELSETEFNGLKQGIIKQLQQPDTDLADRMTELSLQGLSRHGHFGWKAEVVVALENLDLGTFRQVFQIALQESAGSRLSLYLDADGSDPSSAVEAEIDDIFAWRNRQGQIKF